MLITATTLEETQAAASTLARSMTIGTPLLLYGDLGTGKTEFARAAIRALAELADMDPASLGEIPSPTFSLLQLYDLDKAEVAHYDLYRLQSTNDLLELDFEESLKNRITLIEWPALAEPMIKNATRVRLTLEGQARRIEIESPRQEPVLGVDENDTPTGTFIRGERPKGIVPRVAAMLVFRSNGNIVLSKTSRYKPLHMMGKLSFTAAGHVNPDEGTEHAAKREFEEELGTPAPENIEFIGTHHAGGNCAFCHVYKTVYDGTFSPDPHETEELKEFTPAELKTLLATNRQAFHRDLAPTLDKLLA